MPSIRAVMFFATDPETQCRWWAEHMIGAEPKSEGPFWWLDGDDGVEVGFHPNDDGRNPFGLTPVVYWKVPGGMEERLRELIAAGCTRHRGPLEAESGRRICQMTDPFGNCFGLDGP